MKWTAAGATVPEGHLTHDLRKNIAEVLGKTGLIEPSAEALDGDITIALDSGAGYKSTFDFRGPGSQVRWVQLLAVTINAGGRTLTKENEQAILIFRGKAKEPEELTMPMTPEVAYKTIVEAMLLRALRDLQREGVFPGGVEQEQAPTGWSGARDRPDLDVVAARATERKRQRLSGGARRQHVIHDRDATWHGVCFDQECTTQIAPAPTCRKSCLFSGLTDAAREPLFDRQSEFARGKARDLAGLVVAAPMFALYGKRHRHDRIDL